MTKREEVQLRARLRRAEDLLRRVLGHFGHLPALQPGADRTSGCLAGTLQRAQEHLDKYATPAPPRKGAKP